jgi:hypothetical protein
LIRKNSKNLTALNMPESGKKEVAYDARIVPNAVNER